MHELLEHPENWTHETRLHAEDTCASRIFIGLYSETEKNDLPEETNATVIALGLLSQGVKGTRHYTNQELVDCILTMDGTVEFLDRVNYRGEYLPLRSRLDEDNEDG